MLFRSFPDSGDVLDLTYSRSGKLFTLGRSVRGQLQIWDPRGSFGSQLYSQVAITVLPTSSYLRVIPHYTKEYCVFCGDSMGIVHEIDLRNSSVVNKISAHSGPGEPM